MPRRRRGMTCTSNATRTRRRIAPDTPSRSREAHTDTAFARRAFPRSHPPCCGPTPLATGNLVAQPLCPLQGRAEHSALLHTWWMIRLYDIQRRHIVDDFVYYKNKAGSGIQWHRVAQRLSPDLSREQCENEQDLVRTYKDHIIKTLIKDGYHIKDNNPRSLTAHCAVRGCPNKLHVKVVPGTHGGKEIQRGTCFWNGENHQHVLEDIKHIATEHPNISYHKLLDFFNRNKGGDDEGRGSCTETFTPDQFQNHVKYLRRKHQQQSSSSSAADTLLAFNEVPSCVIPGCRGLLRSDSSLLCERHFEDAMIPKQDGRNNECIRVDVRSTAWKGRGLFLLDPVCKGQLIAVYGTRNDVHLRSELDVKGGDDMFAHDSASDLAVCRPKDSIAIYANHSCRSDAVNAEIYRLSSSQGNSKIWLRATKAIPHACSSNPVEVLWNYDVTRGPYDKGTLCRCGMPFLHFIESTQNH